MLYVILALLGLGFLIFIHELGHYFMARKVGMRVEVFSIGLGKPLLTWIFQDVKWQLCLLPFGGYVKIAGEKEELSQGNKTPDEDTFLGKRPWDRIKVALMGPIVNIVFAFILFTVIWVAGGKQEPFSRHTNIIGYVDPDSELYTRGVRPGDQILRYNHKEFNGFKDLLYASVLNQSSVGIQGNKIDYYTQDEESFSYELTPYPDPRAKGGDFKTIGVLTPASVLLFSKLAENSDFPLDQSPMKGSGIEFGDRIIWARGELVFSMAQLAQLVNEPKVLLYVQRGNEELGIKVPRIQIGDLRLTESQRVEFEDWRHQIHRKGAIKQLAFIPYMLDTQGVVQYPLAYIGEDAEEHTIYDEDMGTVLKPGDRILGVDGVAVQDSYGLMEAIQTRRIQLIVQRGFPSEELSWENESRAFVQAMNPQDLTRIVSKAMSGESGVSIGNLHVLKPVEPILLSDLPLSSSKKNWLLEELTAQQERIEKIQDPSIRAQAMKALERQQQKLVLGIPLVDVMVRYNPNPIALFSQVIGDTAKTLGSLFTGKLNPKWMSGPIGMVQIIHHGWNVGIKEALFWMATISLSLGIFNLFPLPVLDGGHICFALYEWIFKRRVSAKAMEKMIIPFVALLVGLFVYVTYQDVIRLFSRFF